MAVLTVHMLQGLPGPRGGEQDELRLNLGCGATETRSRQIPGSRLLIVTVWVCRRQTQPPTRLVAIHSRGNGAQTAEGLGLILGTEACPCPKTSSSERVMTPPALRWGTEGSNPARLQPQHLQPYILGFCHGHGRGAGLLGTREEGQR